MTVAFVNASAWFDGATGLTADKVLTLPSHSTGNLILVLAAWKDFAITAQISGYTEITEFADGSVATGNGTGSMKVGAWYKVAASGAESNPTLDFSTTTGLVGEACVLVFSKTESDWLTPGFVTGAVTDFVAGPLSSSALVVPSGGAVICLLGCRDDSATFTRPAISIGATTAGITWNGNGAEAPATHASTTTGNDMAADAGYRLVTTGATRSMLAAVDATSGTETGAALWIAIGDVAAGNQLVTPTTAALVATKFAPTVTASDHQLVTVPTAGGAGYSAAVTADSPVAYWRLGEPSGTTATAAVGPNGTYQNTPTLGVTGLIAGDSNTAVAFDRTASEAVGISTGMPAGSTTGASVEMWLDLPAIATNDQYTLWSQGVVGTTGHHMLRYRQVDGTDWWLYWYFSDGTARAPFAEYVTDVLFGPHHLVAVHDYTAETIKFYIDGALSQTEDVSAFGTVTQLASNLSSRIAGYMGNNLNMTTGTLDEVAVYTTALSSTQVLAHYTAGTTAGGLVLTTYAPTVTVAAPQLVTPTTATLTATTYAPTVTATDNQLVTPTTKAAVLATFAPTITATDLQLVTPTTKALTLTTFAPVVSTPELATPSTVSLALTTFAPSISVTDNQAVTPTTKALTLTTFAPTVTATDPQLVTPTTAAVTLSTFAPTVTAAAHQQVTPSTAALSLQAFAPTVTATDQQVVTPTTKALTLAAFAPTVLTPELVTPTTKALVLATFAPVVSNPDPQSVTPITKALTLATFAPSVGVSDAASIVPPNAALSLTTYAPTVIQPDPQLVTPTTPALELHTFEPLVTATAHQAVTPTTAALVTTRHIPTVAATANQSAIPATKALTLTVYAPQVTVNNIVATVNIGLTLTTFAPSVTAGTNTYTFPDPASLTLTGYAPFIDLSAFKLVTPATAVLVLTTYPPTAEQHSITPLPTPIYGFAVIATGPGAGVGSANGGATVTTSEGGSTAVSSSGPSARVTIR